MYASRAAPLNFNNLRSLLKVRRARAPQFSGTITGSFRSLGTATERSEFYGDFDAENGNYSQNEGSYGNLGVVKPRNPDGAFGQSLNDLSGTEKSEFHNSNSFDGNKVENQLGCNSGNQNSGFHGINLDRVEQNRNPNGFYEYNFGVKRGEYVSGNMGNGQQTANSSGCGHGVSFGMHPQNHSAAWQQNSSGRLAGQHNLRGGNEETSWGQSAQNTEHHMQNGVGIGNAGNCPQNWTGAWSNGVPYSPLHNHANLSGEQVDVTERIQTRCKMEDLDEFIREEKLTEAVECLGQLQSEGVQVDVPRYLALMKACGDAQALDEAKVVHEHLLKAMPHLEVRTYNRILGMYSSCGSVEDAFKVFNQMLKRNLTSWDIMISGLAKNGLGEDAIELFQEFKRSGLQPDGQMFITVFSACGVTCDVIEGMLHFESMVKHYSILPTMEHYVSIVDMMGNAGCLDEALEFIESMPVKPCVDIWETLMKFCRIHGNTELGDRCMEIIDILDAARLNEQSRAGLIPINPADTTRDNRKTKSSGQNLPDVTRRVHEYRAGDRSHPDHERIYSMLWGLKQQAKEAGYIPDTRFVLHDVDQEVKEEALMAHSERLAVAQGLLTSTVRSPMRIIKNLRACGDCHNIFKIISTIVGRELIVRDSKRFHHFKGGSCSCNDYW